MELIYEEDDIFDPCSSAARGWLHQPTGRSGHRGFQVAYLRLLWRLD
jgi:hypothetical protein